jgi:hypothetical protein
MPSLGQNGGAMNDSFACRADAFAVDRLAAGDAQRRQRDVERKPRGMAPRAAARIQRAAQVGRDGT